MSLLTLRRVCLAALSRRSFDMSREMGSLQLTCSDLHVTAEHSADGVARDASVRRAVNVLSISRSRKRQEHQGAVSEHSPDARDIVHRMPVRGRPVDIGLRTSGGRAVQPGAAGIREFDPRRRLQLEAGAAQVSVEAVPARGRYYSGYT